MKRRVLFLPSAPSFTLTAIQKQNRFEMNFEATRSSLSVALGGAALLFVWALRRRSRSRLPFPPGPKGYPLIHNLLDAPLVAPWEGYAELAKVHGAYAL